MAAILYGLSFKDVANNISIVVVLETYETLFVQIMGDHENILHIFLQVPLECKSILSLVPQNIYIMFDSQSLRPIQIFTSSCYSF